MKSLKMQGFKQKEKQNKRFSDDQSTKASTRIKKVRCYKFIRQTSPSDIFSRHYFVAQEESIKANGNLREQIQLKKPMDFVELVLIRKRKVEKNMINIHKSSSCCGRRPFLKGSQCLWNFFHLLTEFCFLIVVLQSLAKVQFFCAILQLKLCLSSLLCFRQENSTTPESK